MSNIDTGFGGGVAVITGAGSGIGAGLVDEAAARGMRIVLADISSEVIEKRAAELRADGLEALARTCDVSSFAEVDKLAQLAFDTWGEVTILVNNAGVELIGRLWEIDVDKWDRIIAINLNGVFYGMRAFIPRMIASGKRSHIVNVSSGAALRTGMGTSGYAASKHAVLAITECAMKELAAVGADIVLSALIPGAVRTSIFENSMMTEGSKFAEHARRDLAAILSTGLDPRQVGALVFDAAARGVTHIHTDPALSRQLLEERFDALIRTV